MSKIKVISGGCRGEGQVWFSKCGAAQVNSSVVSMSVKVTGIAQLWQHDPAESPRPAAERGA